MDTLRRFASTCFVSFTHQCSWRKGGKDMSSLLQDASIFTFIPIPIHPSIHPFMGYVVSPWHKKIPPTLCALNAVYAPAQNILWVVWLYLNDVVHSFSFSMVLMWFRYHSTSLLEISGKKTKISNWGTADLLLAILWFHVSAQTGMNDL